MCFNSSVLVAFNIVQVLGCIYAQQNLVCRFFAWSAKLTVDASQTSVNFFMLPLTKTIYQIIKYIIHETNRCTHVPTLQIIPPTSPEEKHPLQSSRNNKENHNVALMNNLKYAQNN